VKTNRLIPDVRFGVYYFTSKYYLGLSVMDLMSEVTDDSKYNWNGNEYSTIRKTRHFYLTGGAMWPLSDVLSFKPSFMVKEDFKGPTNFDLNASFLIAERVWLGASWRSGVKMWNKDHLQNDLDNADAFSFLAEFFANDNLRIGYAYDYMYNGLSNYQRGTHEISIGYSFNSRKARMRVLSPRYF
jgi:type IX secretion system PorP/SprF family membrane protein